jgi:cell fate (sporulation/competence/biofilm development) regulator YmcA (YheA/YmcA/DUF963 family)
MERQSFIFYIEWRNALIGCSEEVRLEVYDAIVEYAASGTLPQLKPMAQMAFNFIKLDIDRNKEKYDTMIEARREAGRRGAEVTNRQKSAKPANAEFAEQKSAKVGKIGYNDNVNDNVNDSLFVREYEPSQTERENFLKILLFEKCLIKPAEELDRFLAHYTKTGWVDKNGNKIVSKDAALKAWNTQEASVFEKPMVFRWYQFFNRVMQNCDKSIHIDKMPFLTDFRGLVQEDDKLVIYCSESLRNQIEMALNSKIIAELNELGIKKLNYKFKN